MIAIMYHSVPMKSRKHIPEHTNSLDGLVMKKYCALLPLPLVFYVHPDKTQLAQLLDDKLQEHMLSGKFDLLFNQHLGTSWAPLD